MIEAGIVIKEPKLTNKGEVILMATNKRKLNTQSKAIFIAIVLQISGGGNSKGSIPE